MRLLRQCTILFLAAAMLLSQGAWVFCMAEGENDPLWNRPSFDKKAFDIGQRILAANGITERIAFRVDHGDQSVNAGAGRSMEQPDTVVINHGLLELVSSDDELAAVLSHEICHIVNRDNHMAHHAANAAGYGVLVAAAAIATAPIGGVGAFPVILYHKHHPGVGLPESHRDESRADLMGIDLMVKAGYNPIAMETVMTKIAGDETALGSLMDEHPPGSERLTNIHNYIQAHYPQFLANGTDSNLPGSPYTLEEKNPELARKGQIVKPGETDSPVPAGTAASTAADPLVTLAEHGTLTSPTIEPPQKVHYPFNEKKPAEPLSTSIPEANNAPVLTTPDALPPVAQQMLTLSPDALRFVRLLSSKGYMDDDLFHQEFADLNADARDIMIEDLKQKQIIRPEGQPPSLVYVLTDRAARVLESH